MSVPFSGSGRRREGGAAATHLQDFKAHVQGNGYLHTADQIQMNPPISTDANIFNQTNVQNTLQSMATFLNSVGQGFVSIADGYSSTTADIIVAANGDIADAFNTAFVHPRLQNGGVILVKASTYHLKKTVNVPPGITIMGELGGTIIIGTVVEQSMFVIKHTGEDRPIISPDGVTTTDPINKNLFCNITLADNLDGYIGNAPTMTTVPMIKVETGAYLHSSLVYFIGKMGSLGNSPTYGRTKTLYAVGTSIVGSEETTISFDHCTFDGMRSIIKYDPGSSADKLMINSCKAHVFGSELAADNTDPTKNCFVLMGGTMRAIISNNNLNGGSGFGQTHVSNLVTFTSGNPIFVITDNEGILTFPFSTMPRTLVNNNGTGNSFKITVSGNDVNSFRDGTVSTRIISALDFYTDNSNTAERVLLWQTTDMIGGHNYVRFYANSNYGDTKGAEFSITVNAMWDGTHWNQDDATTKSIMLHNGLSGGIGPTSGWFVQKAGASAWTDTNWLRQSVILYQQAVTDGTKLSNFQINPNGIIQLSAPSSGSNAGDSNPASGSTAITANTLYAKNITKAWCRLVINGDDTVTVNDSFGINTGTITLTSTYVQIHLSIAMTSTNYVIVTNSPQQSRIVFSYTVTDTSTFRIFFYDPHTNTYLDPTMTQIYLSSVILGEQSF